VCQGLGQGPYDPKIDPQNFVKNISNSFMPLKPGAVYIYDLNIPNSQGTDTFFVTRQTIDLLGVTCVVVRDTGTIGGQVEEDTFDYFAQDKQGNVWYFGEDTTQLQDGVVVGVEGSWRAGVNGAKPGIIMKATPKVGDEYRQEFALGTAEDMAKVVALDQKVKVPFGSFSNVLKTLEFSGLEPDARENKYYVLSCTRFLWTRHCRSRNREEQRDGQRDRRDGCGCWGCGQRGRATFVHAVHSPR
jgi:hypothetical protein